MPDTTVNTQYFLEREGAKFLVETLVAKLDEKTLALLNSRIVTTIDSSSTDEGIASAKAVYDLVQSKLTAEGSAISFQIVDAVPETGADNTIYLIKLDPNNADDTTYVQWIYLNDQWINLGGTNVDLSGYWSKEELQPLTTEQITAIIEEVIPSTGDSTETTE